MNNMMMNNGYVYGGMTPTMGGAQYVQQQAKMTQPLTAEEIKKLKSTGGVNALVVNDIDITKAKCTHKLNGQLALTQNANGTHTCNVCGETFNIVDTDPSEIEVLTSRMIDVLQSIKTFYLDMPEKYATEFFVLMPLLKNTPMLYKIALNQFSKYESGGMTSQSNNMYSFGLYNALTTPGMNYNMGMMNPMQNHMNMGMNPAMQNQMYNNMNMGMNPAMQNQMNMNYNMNMGMNPMGNAFTGEGVPQNNMTTTANQIKAQEVAQNAIQGNNTNQQPTTSKQFGV